MKKIIFGIIAAIAMIAGCKTVWTSDESYKVGTAVGYTTAYVLNNQVKVDDTTRDVIIKVVDIAQKYVPGSNETFTVAWTKILNEYVDGLVKEGKLTESQANRIKKDFAYITTLLDAYVEKKGLKQYQDCVDAFVDGFCSKFLENFKPVNFSSSVNRDNYIDEFAYGFLESEISK